MKIGLLTKDCNSLFKAGINQQCIFTYNLLSNTNYTIKIYGYNAKNQYMIDELKNNNYFINNVNEIVSDGLDVLICISNCLVNNIFNKIKNDTKVVMLVAGNYLHLLHENYLHKLHNNIIEVVSDNNFHEIWTFDMYKYMMGYLNTLYKKQIRIIPYTWDTTVIQSYKENMNIINNNKGGDNKTNIVIVEPNLSYHKSSFIPLIICERLLDKNIGYIEKIFLLCSEEINKEYVNILKNIRDKVEYYPRIEIYKLMESLNKLETQTIFVSNTIDNDLNFVSFEIIDCNWKLVHNSSTLKEYGYYYNDTSNIEECAEVLEKAINNCYNSQEISMCKNDCIENISRIKEIIDINKDVCI